MAKTKTIDRKVNGIYTVKIVICEGCGQQVEGGSCQVCRGAKLDVLLKRSIWRKIRDFVGL